MSQAPPNPQDNPFQDHLVIKHPDGRSEEYPLPDDQDNVIQIGRELDNDVVLVDPRASRHHAQIRRMASVLEIKDLNSANGVFINQNRIEADTWTKITPGQTIQLAETRLTWQKPASSQSTVAMSRQQRSTTAVSATPPPVARKPSTALLPWAMGLGAVVLLVILAGLVFLLLSRGSGEPDVAAGQTAPAEAPAEATAQPSPDSDQGADRSIAQTPAGGPTDTPTPSGPQLAIPVLEVESVQVSPIIFGASPSTNRAYIFIDVRARNAGNVPFQFSISNFSLQSTGGQTFVEAGQNTSENYLRQLGAIDRFENLALTPGGSVPGSLVFELEIGTYNLELLFDVPDLQPLVLGLGTINMDRELKLAAGTPLAALDSEAAEEESTPTPTPQPSPTPTRPALIPAPQVVPRSSLAGTIAYPVFNGTDFDIYFGDVSSSETEFFRAHASQPAFSPDGSRIAFHSWDNASRGLMTMDVSGANPVIIATFIEDQLPTWTADGENIIFLSRRSGDRKSQLITVGSSQERSEGTVIGEGEYPTVGPNNQLVFKGWGNTAFGLRRATTGMENIQTITNVEEDTAPVLSPDGEKVAFMSRREGDNWDIYVANVDGSNLLRLTTNPARDGLPAWSPDGNAIAFVSDRGGIWAIWVMTPEGKGHSQLFTMEGSPDGFVGSDTYASRGWAEERISWIR